MSSEERIAIFPVTGINSGIVNVMDSVIRGMIADQFPPGFLKGGVHIDTRTGIRDMFRNEQQITNNASKNKIESISKIDKPRLLTTYRWTNFDTKASGLTQNPLSQYPNTHFLRLDMLGYDQIYQDPNEVKLYTSNLRVKIDFDVILDMRTRDDQLSGLSYLYSFLKFQGCQPITGIKTRFIMPNSLLFGLYKMYYGDGDITAKSASSFANHMNRFSNGFIERKFINGQENRSLYVMNREYKRVYVQFTGEPEMSDPEVKEKIFDKFSITFSGFLETYIPTTYMLRCPDVVGNTIVLPALFPSFETNEQAGRPVKFYSRLSNSKARRNCPDLEFHQKTVVNEDCWFDTVEDTSSYLEILPVEHQRLIAKMEIPQALAMYRFDFLRDGIYLNPGTFVFPSTQFTTIDDVFTFTLKQLDPTICYQVVVYCDMHLFNAFQAANPPPTPDADLKEEIIQDNLLYAPGQFSNGGSLRSFEETVYVENPVSTEKKE